MMPTIKIPAVKMPTIDTSKLKTVYDSVATSRQALMASAIFAGCALFAILWGCVFFVWNWQLESEFDAKTERLNSLRRAGLSDPSGDKRLNAKSAAVPAPTETIAASTLQQYILSRVEASGGSAQSIQSEPTRDVNTAGLQRINAQLSFEGSINSLQQVLFDLEAGEPFVFVDTIAVQPATAPGARVGDRLRVTLMMSSYWLKKDPSGSSQ